LNEDVDDADGREHVICQLVDRSLVRERSAGPTWA